MDPLLLGTAAAFGLAASAGLNTTLPLLIVGALARFGMLGLAAPYDVLASDTALAGLALLAVLEFVGDKVPALDSAVQGVQWPLAAAAGAILFASQNSAIEWVSPELALFVGLLTAGTVHGIRTAVRPLVTGSTLGLGNPFISLVEDIFAVGLVGAALLAPSASLVLAVVLIPLVALLGFLMIRGGLGISRRQMRGSRHADG